MTGSDSVVGPDSVVGTAAAIGAGRVSAAEVTRSALDRINRLNPGLNAVTEVLAGAALAAADACDDALQSGSPPGPLTGVPMVVKSELDVAGSVTTFGGRSNLEPPAADSEVVRRVRAAGAVLVARTAMPEFGAWPYTESVAYGLTRNPWDRGASPGGSSGGTAVAVASGMVAAGLGGDGGGSIRIPSACCGVFGLKPQRGRVSTAPMPHLWWSLGTVGPLTRSVLDSAVIYDVISGNVPADRYRAGPVGSFAQAALREPGRLRIGWSLRAATPGLRLDPLHVRAVADTVRLFSELGHQVRQVDLAPPDPTAAFIPQFFAGIRAEAAMVQRPRLLERRTRLTCRLGSWVTPGVRESAIRAGERISTKVNRVFDEVDVLLTPVLAHRPPPVGILEGTGPVRATLRSLPAVAYTALWNVAGNPAASVPRGVGPDGLPLAVQLIGPTDGEEVLFALSAQLEAAAPWHFPPATG